VKKNKFRSDKKVSSKIYFCKALKQLKLSYK